MAPLVSLGDAPLVPKQLYESLREVLPDLTLDETRRAVIPIGHTLILM